MASDAERSLTQRKIFPRNLTARADAVVRGNPANARPESGVDNTHPGLEFDQRNLDKAFFPGLVFEFQYLLGAKLAEVNPELATQPFDLKPDDANSDIYLWYVFGAFGAKPDKLRLVDLYGMDGYEVLRTIHDLEAGKLVVILGKSPDAHDLAQLQLWSRRGMEFSAAIEAMASGKEPPAACPPLRDARGKLLAAILVGKRADYLDKNGVIAASVVPAGGLTRSLCAPWQWDFADCGCHYWAANKPDIVIGPDGGPQTLDFQRDRKAPPAPQDNPLKYDAWISNQMTQPDMVVRWEELPFVIAERETEKASSHKRHELKNPWCREQVVHKLTELAGVEHALCVEYLYAHYSLKLPRYSKMQGREAHDISRAARELFTIAVDEMHHFRWVNEALRLLDAPPSLARANKLGDNLQREPESFKLDALTPERLNFFIDVEAPSKTFKPDEEDISGLYTHMLASLRQTADQYRPEIRERVSELLRSIIDEGHDHFEAFKRIKSLLEPYYPTGYLRVKGPPELATDTKSRTLQRLGDEYYRALLSGLRLAFQVDARSRSELVKQAHRTMNNLDEIGQALAEKGVGLLFSLPSPWPW